MLDALLLSRIQFGFTVGFHILFPTLTIGLAWFLVFVEARWHRTARPVWIKLYLFWVKIFALTFGMGVVSGLVLSYQFGTNFSRFSEIAGPVMGPLLSVEVLTAFFVEAGFLGVMLFGWNKVGPRLHFLATLLVAIGTTNSAIWILAANSWMHTPAGVEWLDGQIVPVDWWAIVFNASFPYRLAHMLAASLITTALVVMAVSAHALLRRRDLQFGRLGLKVGATALALMAPLQVFIGDQHGLAVREFQPVKVAAMEGLWETTRGAPLLLFALPDQAAETNHYELGIPKLASLILTHDLDGEVQGLKSVPAADRPPVATVFWAFRIMVGLGMLFILLGLLAAWHSWRNSSERQPWLLRAMICAAPAGFVATVAGWIVAESGRQPWLIHGMFRTAEGVSPVSAQAVLTTLILFVLVYGILFAGYLSFVLRLIRQGPKPVTLRYPAAMRGARAAEIVE